MGLLGKLFGGDPEAKREISAREAFNRAQEALQEQHPGGDRRLCCIYTSPVDSNAEVTAEGTSRAWHIDFHAPSEKKFFLVRVQDGKTRVREKAAKGDAQFPTAEYVYGLCGDFGQGGLIEPVRITDSWIDSTQAAEAAKAQIRGAVGEERLGLYAPMCMLLPAGYFRHGQPETLGKLIQTPPPSKLCYLVLMTTENADDDDAFAAYVDAADGKAIHHEKFRFPGLFDHGFCADW